MPEKMQKAKVPMEHHNMADFLRGQSSKILSSLSKEDKNSVYIEKWKTYSGCHV